MTFDDVDHVLFHTIRAKEVSLLLRSEHHREESDKHRVSIVERDDNTLMIYESAMYRETLEIADAIADVIGVAVVCGPTGLVRER